TFFTDRMSNLETQIDSLGQRIGLLAVRLIESGFEFERPDEVFPGPILTWRSSSRKSNAKPAGSRSRSNCFGNALAASIFAALIRVGKLRRRQIGMITPIRSSFFPCRWRSRNWMNSLRTRRNAGG